MKDTPNTHCTAIIIVARIDNQYEKKCFQLRLLFFLPHTSIHFALVQFKCEKLFVGESSIKEN